MSTLSISRLFEIPWAGEGHFRIIPYPLFRRGIRNILSNQDFIFYLHPWELDPEQPELANLSAPYRFRHYMNLDKTEERLHRLLDDFEWQPIGKRIG